ncbi:androglobin-like [Octopus bimaculoides]|uniref:androglobin-like n=1 Tax=Octopus bimaculoides TaxID=37653 RepID=UPI00071E2EB7|nr:androglobin-like [Octopus bimaculoides]|eukprot:XP_014773781.1 PREDICTED: androglobin-like [Octopus bimaculoides]
MTTEPPSIFLKDRVPRIDLTPFMKNMGKPVKYLTEELLNNRQLQKEMKVEAYRSDRKRAEEWLENERRSLKILKAKQIESCQQMQLQLDHARENFFQQREEYRQSCIKIMEENQIDLDEKDLKPPFHKKGAKKGPNKTANKTKK